MNLQDKVVFQPYFDAVKIYVLLDPALFGCSSRGHRLPCGEVLRVCRSLFCLIILLKILHSVPQTMRSHKLIIIMVIFFFSFRRHKMIYVCYCFRVKSLFIVRNERDDGSTQGKEERDTCMLAMGVFNYILFL